MLVFRFSFLSEPPIYDEIYSISSANPFISFHTAWQGILLQDVNLPLYNLLLRAWAAVVPFTLPWMRVLSAFFSLAVVPAAWFGAPSYWPKLKKTIFCLLLAGSSTLTISGNLLRAYPIGVFTLTLTLLFALRIVHNLVTSASISRTTWAVFFISGFITAYLHYFGAALFFITALGIFIYTLFYKKYRLLVFICTGIAFFAWFPWVVRTYHIMGNFTGQWWYQTTVWFSSWKILEFLFGAPSLAAGLFCVFIVGIVSFLFSEKKTTANTLDIIFPLLQLITLVLVVQTLSHWYNLWLDRYFIFCLPSIFILVTALLYHLYQRHRLLIILLPLLLSSWLLLLFNRFWPTMQDITGLQQTMEYVSQKPHVKQVLFAYDYLFYPAPAQTFVAHYFVPPEGQIQLIPLTQENISLLKQHVPLVVPLCSFLNLTDISYKYNFEAPEPVVAFGETCILEQPYD